MNGNQPKNDVKTRLLAYLAEKKCTQSSFCNAIGVSSAYIASMRNSLSPDKLLRVAENFPDLNITWLLTGNGPMLNDKNVQTQIATSGNIANGSNNNQTVVTTDDTFWKELVSQLREDLKYWKDRCTSAEEHVKKLEDLKDHQDNNK